MRPVPPFVLAVTSLALLGCSEWTVGKQKDPPVRQHTGLDTEPPEADADTDSDADSDADSDPGRYDGDYAGELVVWVSERTTGVAGECLGELILEVDHAADPRVHGTGGCTIVDDEVARTVPPLDFVLQGTLAGPSVSGQVRADAGGFEDTSGWAGNFSSDDPTAFEGSWTGEIWYYHYVIEYEARATAIEATR